MQLNFKIKDDHIQLLNATVTPVNKSVNYLTAAFDIDDAWDGARVTAVFCGRSNDPVSVLLDGITNICVIPWEALQSDVLKVSAYGIKENDGQTVRITSNTVELRLDKAGPVQGAEPLTPSFTSWEQVVSRINDIEAGVVPAGSIGMEKLDDELQNKINTKADKQNVSGGFAGGRDADAYDGGGAVGNSARVIVGGGAVGQSASADSGGAIGKSARSNTGGAVGQSAYANTGGAVGQNARAELSGGAVGQNAITTDGFAGGKDAKCEDSNGAPTDAIQLGTGTNVTAKTLQVYDYKLMNADGTIPYERYGAAVDTKIAEAKSIIPKRYIVSELPTTDIDENGTYLVPADEPNTDNVYTEYAYINNAWEIIGNPEKVDLSDYYTTQAVDDMLSYKYDDNTYVSWVDESGEIVKSKSANMYGVITKSAKMFDSSSDVLTTVSKNVVDAINELNSGKSDKPTITTSAETDLTVTLAHNTETRCGEVTSMTLTLPSTTADDYISSIVFTSGVTPTNLVYPDTIKMIGEGCIDGVFTPAASKRYEVIVSYDGANVVGVVGGYAI
jgi:hypothetical protein